MALRDLAGLERLGRAGFKPVLLPDAWRRAGTQPAVPAGRTPGRLRLSVSAETAGASSTSRTSRSTSQTPSSSSAVRESARDSGSWLRQASYSACRVRSWSWASAHRGGRARRSLGRWKVRTGSPALWRSRYRCWRSAFVMPMRAILHRYITGSSTASLATARGGRGPRSGRTAILSTRLEPGLTPPASWTKPAVDSHIVQVHVPLLSSFLAERARLCVAFFPAFLGLLLSARASGPARSE